MRDTACVVAAVLLSVLALPVALAQAAALTEAHAALQAGEADRALALLRPLVQQGTGAAEAHQLECRVWLTLEEWENAVSECEQAVKLDRQNASNHLWLGRALGEKAGRATFLSAYSLAKRVRGEFEEAVRLGPRNPEALADLGEYYKEAPEVIGGGTGKAEALVAQLDQLDPARAHQLRASIAEKRKDYGTAERELKQSIAASAHPAQPWIEMAGFLGRRARWTEMERAVETGANLAARDAHPSAALLDGASLLLRFHRNQILAAKMLEAYLAGNAKSEEAPAFVAHLRLAQVKDDLGDPAGAGKERAAALAMAHEYKPAQKAKH